MSKKKRPEKNRPVEKKLSSKQAERLEQARALQRRARWADAGHVLAQLEHDHPDVPEILLAYLDFAQAVRDTVRCEDLAQRLLVLRPRDPQLLLFAATTHMACVHPALGMRSFREFLRRWPEHPEAAKVRARLPELEKLTREQLVGVGLGDSPEALEQCALHEELQICLNRGRYARCVQLADELLKLRPDFVPALNNSAQALWLLDRAEPAMERCRRVLAIQADNIHALANLARFLMLSGRVAEAEQAAQGLKTVAVPNPDSRIKILETLSFLGDDDAILEHGAQLRDVQLDPHSRGLVEHLLATARYRKGDEEGARRGWEEALRHAPSLELASRNLADLRRPVGERHAGWAYSFEYWVPRTLIDAQMMRIKAGERKKASDQRAIVRAYLKDTPRVVGLIEPLLERGDEGGRTWALLLATGSRAPELLPALHAYGLGKRGPDNLRLQAVQVLLEEGVLSSNRLKMWARGKQSEVQLYNFQITHESESQLAPEVEALNSEAYGHLQAGRGPEAEVLLRRAITLDPNAPNLQNNLAAALELQKRHSEYESIIRAIHDQHPDYFFGRANLARLELKAGNADRAEELLLPLYDQQKLHSSEFRALAHAVIDLGLARRRPETVRFWLDMWRRILGDEPPLQAIRKQVELFVEGLRLPPWR